MAPLPQNNTTRLLLDYITGNLSTSQEHTVSFRVASSQDDNAKQTAVLGFFTALGAATLNAGWRFLRARVQTQGTNFTYPVPLIAGLSGFVGTSASAFAPSREAIEWTWQGRSFTSGRNVDFSIYGIAALIPDNFRLPVGGSSPAWVAATVNALNGAGTEVLAIDGTEATWYSYVNANYNSYWESRIRLS